MSERLDQRLTRRIAAWRPPATGADDGVASASESGSTSSIVPAKISSAVCQENAWISECASGE